MHCDCCHKPLEQCRVILEMRDIREGTAITKYRAELAQRIADREAGHHSHELTYERMQKSGVPGLPIATLRRGCDRNEAYLAAERFWRLDPTGMRVLPFLVLLGPVGRGKTVAAAWVVQQFVREWRWNEQPTTQEPVEPCMFVEASRLTRLSDYASADQQFFRQLERTHLLVLDDIGDEASEPGKAKLLDVLMARDAASRRTILTGNVNSTKFRARYGDAIADRLNTRGIAPNLTGPSLRRRPELQVVRDAK